MYAKKGTHGKGNSSRFVTTWICVYVCVVVVVVFVGGGGDGCCVFLGENILVRQGERHGG